MADEPKKEQSRLEELQEKLETNTLTDEERTELDELKANSDDEKSDDGAKDEDE